MIVDLLYKKYLNKYIVLTLSENGICTLEDGNIFFHHENVQTDLFDISGAGDTIISVITFALSNGYNLNEAVKFSLKAVKNVISKFGTTAIDNMDILNQMKV